MTSVYKDIASLQTAALAAPTCLYERWSIFRYIHFARLISEARLVRSPMDIDCDQGSVGNGGPFLLRALRLRPIARAAVQGRPSSTTKKIGGERNADSDLKQLND